MLFRSVRSKRELGTVGRKRGVPFVALECGQGNCNLVVGIPPRGRGPGDQNNNSESRRNQRNCPPVAGRAPRRNRLGRFGLFPFRRLRAQMLRTCPPPCFQLVPISEHRAALLQLQAMHRQAFLDLPPLNSSHATADMRGNCLPGVEPDTRRYFQIHVRRAVLKSNKASRVTRGCRPRQSGHSGMKWADDTVPARSRRPGRLHTHRNGSESRRDSPTAFGFRAAPTISIRG